MASNKIPPHLARELRRHVAKTKSSSGSGSNGGNSSRTRNVLLGCVAFTGVAASIPFVAMKWIGGLNDREDELTSAQVRRGAFMNSGSRDAGRDPNWDFKTGTYIKDEKYEELFNKDDPNKLDLGEEFFKRRQ